MKRPGNREPVAIRMKELIEICAALKTLGGQPCALATVIHVDGSAYRRPGARMLMTPEGQAWGMVSGGCLEHDILDHGRRALQSGRARVVRYDSTSEDDIVFGTGLGCNGVIDVFIEPMTEGFRETFIQGVERCQKTRRAGAIATMIDGVTRHAFLTDGGWTGNNVLLSLLEDLPPPSEKPVLLSGDAGGDAARVFVQPLLPPIQLVVFGGWLDVIPLIRLARAIGLKVVVVDSRQRQSSRRHFREADAVLLCSPCEALAQVQFDARTVAVLMNHNFDRDQEALAALTQVSLPFLGMLGPRRRRQRILDNLRDDGVGIPDGFVRHLHGPVGLDIGAETPEEIALSILAEILAVLNGRDARPVRDRATPLHVPQPALAYA